MVLVKGSKVVSFIKQYVPELLDEQNRIILDTIDITYEITLEDQQAKDLIGKIISYGYRN